MYIRQNIYKLFIVFSMVLFFIISSCSEPLEEKKVSSKQTTEASQAAQASKPETQEVATPKPETPAPEAQKSAPESAKPKPAAPVSKPVKPEPVPPKPAKKSSLADVIAMDNPAYSKHKKNIVLFAHNKHVAKYKVGCGECHHDKEGKPLTGLKENDAVENCIACHTKPGKAPRPKDKTKLSLKEKLEYHAEAIHKNCIECHKEYNKQNDTKAAPASCSKCHPKKE